LQLADGPRAWWIDELVDAVDAEDVDLAGAELGFVGADCEEGLDGFVGQTAMVGYSVLVAATSSKGKRDERNLPDLGVDAVASQLVRAEMTWLDKRRQVLLHARLLPAKKASHGDAAGCPLA
jgi:hypothetical protein